VNNRSLIRDLFEADPEKLLTHSGGEEIGKSGKFDIGIAVILNILKRCLTIQHIKLIGEHNGLGKVTLFGLAMADLSCASFPIEIAILIRLARR
jgi:hypothetical protein